SVAPPPAWAARPRCRSRCARSPVWTRSPEARSPTTDRATGQARHPSSVTSNPGRRHRRGAAMPARWKRFVAVGDSFTEGLDDLLPDGYPRGWAQLVAAHVAHQDEDFRYANLAVRSRRIEQIVIEQIPEAMAMRPDLTSIVAGGNDILGFPGDLHLIADN